MKIFQFFTLLLVSIIINEGKTGAASETFSCLNPKEPNFLQVCTLAFFPPSTEITGNVSLAASHDVLIQAYFPSLNVSQLTQNYLSKSLQKLAHLVKLDTISINDPAPQLVLTFDEVQAGFGRTGKFWAFEHYGVTPDIICCGKGISSGMPLSAVIGKEAVMDQFGPGSMTSTHTGNPVCCAAASENIRKILDEDLTGNAARLGPILHERCKAIQKRHPSVIGHVTCAGLVAGMQTIVPGKKEPNHDLAHRIIELCYQRGLLLFAPVGAWGQTVKICPPLTVTQEALEEACDVLDTAVDDAVREMSA